VSVTSAKENIVRLLGELRRPDAKGGQQVGMPSLYAGLNPHVRKELIDEMTMLLMELADDVDALWPEDENR
jgi:hypothetical protein